VTGDARRPRRVDLDLVGPVVDLLQLAMNAAEVAVQVLDRALGGVETGLEVAQVGPGRPIDCAAMVSDARSPRLAISFEALCAP
jgi:hypothetical protein